MENFPSPWTETNKLNDQIIDIKTAKVGFHFARDIKSRRRQNIGCVGGRKIKVKTIASMMLRAMLIFSIRYQNLISCLKMKKVK